MRHHLYSLLSSILLLLSACSADPDLAVADGEGRLSLSLGNITTETRSTPSELGVPEATEFNLRVVNASGRAVYDGLFRDEELSVPVGTYTIVATYGDNPLLGIDVPFYVGTATAEVQKDETTSVTVPCSVGNALVSVFFGGDAATQARFARFYSSYGVRVRVGDYSASITNAAPERSVYVRAGTTVALTFEGRLAANEQAVSMPLTLPAGISSTLEAADHLKLTLSLASEDAAVINVEKAEVDSVTIEKKIPYDWLPAPTVTPTHRYDADGYLVGTDLATSASFPDLTWSAQIHQGSATGAVVRTLTGTGALVQSYTEDSAWPFLPAGTYVATFTYTSQQGTTYTSSKTRTFTVAQPSLTLTVGGYSSYTKYQEGDIEAANACERLTVYAPSAQWSVAPTLLTNANYSSSFTYSYRGTSYTAPAGSNHFAMADQTNQPVSASTYPFRVTATFCGQTLTGSRDFRITGLPVTFNPPTASNWTRSGSGAWDAGYAKIGNRGGIWVERNEYIRNTSSVNIPAGTKICLDYNIMIHPATMGTTFSVVCGSQTIYSQQQSGGAANTTDYPFQGTTAAITASATITQLQCNNSYGGGATCSNIYSLTFKYSN